GDVADALRRILANDLLQLLETDRMLLNESAVGASGLNDKVQQTIHNGLIGARVWSEMHVGLARGRCPAWIDDDKKRRTRTAPTIQKTHPQDRFRHGHIGNDDENAVGDIDISVGGGL